VRDVHAVVRVERHEDVVDLERVAFDQIGDTLRVFRSAGDCERPALVEVVLRVDYEQRRVVVVLFDRTAVENGRTTHRAVRHMCRRQREAGGLGVVEGDRRARFE
jgi:hypothetical protein